MNRALKLSILFALISGSGLQAAPLEIACPAPTHVTCLQLDNLDSTGRATATGGCGEIALSYRDSIMAPDSLVVRTWSAADSCGEVVTCFQPIVLTARRPQLAVLPLENLSTAEEGPRVLQRLLEDALRQASSYDLVSPAKVDDAVLRGRVRQPVLMDDRQRTQLAAASGADYFLVGSLLNYETFQDQYSGPIPMISCTLQLFRAGDGRVLWSDSFHAVGNDGEWLFALGVEHDITRLGRELSRKVAQSLAKVMLRLPCTSSR